MCTSIIFCLGTKHVDEPVPGNQESGDEDVWMKRMTVEEESEDLQGEEEKEEEVGEEEEEDEDDMYETETDETETTETESYEDDCKKSNQ